MTRIAERAAEWEIADPRTFPRKRWTRAEYRHMLDVGLLENGAPYELIEGDVVKKVTINQPHAVACRRTTRNLSEVFGEEFVMAQAPIALDDDNEPEPDVYVLNKPVESFLDDAPAAEFVLLVVELSDSSLSRDLGFKASLYARAGIPEYWSLNIIGRSLVVHRQPGAQGYEEITALPEGEIVAPLARPNAKVAIGDPLPPLR